MNVPQLTPYIGNDEYKAVEDCFKNNWITEGPKAKEFVERLLRIDLCYEDIKIADYEPAIVTWEEPEYGEKRDKRKICLEFDRQYSVSYVQEYDTPDVDSYPSRLKAGFTKDGILKIGGHVMGPDDKLAEVIAAEIIIIKELNRSKGFRPPDYR